MYKPTTKIPSGHRLIFGYFQGEEYYPGCECGDKADFITHKIAPSLNWWVKHMQEVLKQ